MENFKDFFSKTAEVRKAQKAYYAYKGDQETKSSLLVKARTLERELDQMIQAFQQPGLFS